MGTSSANPSKLGSYSTDGLDLIETLRSKSDAVTEAVEAVSASGSEHVPAMGDAHTTLSDLVGDWFHLDEFVGDVAEGFRQADEAGAGGVITVSDEAIARLGQVGFADRDEAIAAAEDAQRRLDELLGQRPEDVDQAELDALFADIARGQHDPAFAVTFSEGIGVDGYVDAMTLIQNVYVTTDGEYRVTDQGMGYAALLGATLTTALDTTVQDGGDYRDPDNADLAPGDRLSYDFIDALARGYEGADHADWPHPSPDDDPNDLIPVRITEPWQLDRNLSVLLSYTDPPDWVAVDIANNRLSPLLNDHLADTGSGPEALVWGDRSGTITNYATMLSGNSDASTQWLYQEQHGLDDGNLELVLDRSAGRDMDGGAALAQIVENGLTNDDVHESVPGAPSYVEGGLMRETLMERAIDHTAELGEIHNDHLNGAFAAGVDSNMSVVDERINAPFGYDEGDRPDSVLDEYRNTHDFLRETMRDAEAARDIHHSVNEFGSDEAASLPDDPEEREARLRQLGRLQGMVTEAEENAGVGAALDELMSDSPLGPTPGSATNYVISWVPYAGQVNDVAAGMGVGAGNGLDWLLGELGDDYDSLSEAEQRARTQRLEDRLERATWLADGLYESDTPQGAELRESAQGQPFVDDDGSLKSPSEMNDEQRQAYREWVWESVGNDDDQGAVYTEDGDIKAGVTDVREGETDVSDRR